MTREKAREEAIKALKKHINRPLGFCPVINETCRMDCVCYCKADIGNVMDGYGVIKEHCTHPAILRSIINYSE